MKKARNIAFALLFLMVFAYVIIAYYPYIFSRRVIGQITAVERVNVAMTMMTVGPQDPSAQMFSFAVAIKDRKTHEIVTASSEDRQWAVAKVGQCAEAEYFPYPPWDLQSWGTYHNARLLKLKECPP